MTALSDTKKYQAYPEYKDSGVEWLDKVPSHWNMFNGERVFCSVRRKALSSDEQLAASQKFGVVPQSLMMELNDAKVMLALKGTDSFRHVEKDNFVISLRSFEGGVEHSAYVGCVSPAYTVLEATKNVSARYYKYLLKSKPYIAALQASTDSLRDGKSISFEQFSNIWLPLFEVDEQTQIANFLDHETAKIDTLIEKQQQLIKLLKEKRQAVISHAVTKGLNPQAPMKDSGVEWLGEVPEHWAVMKFNHCAQIRNGLVDPKGTKYRDMVLYAPNHIEKATGKVLYRETASEQGADSNKYLCYQGEVIYSKIRPALAKVAICTEELALCSADMYPISCINGLTNEWLYWFMLSDSFTKAVVLDSDRVAMPKVNRESLGDFRIPFPTESEQSDISSRIKAQTQKLDVLEAKANHAIKLMQERRTALISAAVTGKIDVRNWQAATHQDQALEQTA
ncbi:restriction endonuclease subunit S [Vibrio jasicida]|uniref:restriction endonuclease subunit S n=1 Tax=Vibrio jasicida TaxID=766224 RepID=UPI0003A43793|nr:restriction endonuclease subunit S [Vibrio jasicida]